MLIITEHIRTLYTWSASPGFSKDVKHTCSSYHTCIWIIHHTTSAASVVLLGMGVSTACSHPSVSCYASISLSSTDYDTCSHIFFNSIWNFITVFTSVHLKLMNAPSWYTACHVSTCKYLIYRVDTNTTHNRNFTWTKHHMLGLPYRQLL
jgi:hypothetical protein